MKSNPIMKHNSAEPYLVSETITPQRALEYLGRMRVNRTLSRMRVYEIARMMKLGRWHDKTFQPIKFNIKGELIDGQHRLQACIAAQTPFSTQVAYNLPEDAVDFLDTGMKARTSADVLTLNGYANANKLAATAQALGKIAVGGLGGLNLSADEVFKVVKACPELPSSIKAVGTTIAVRGATVAALHYIAENHMLDSELAASIVDVFSNGLAAYKDDPLAFINTHVQRNRNKKIKMHDEAEMKALVHALNKRVKLETMKQLHIPKGGAFLADWTLEMLFTNDLDTAKEIAEAVRQRSRERVKDSEAKQKAGV